MKKLIIIIVLFGINGYSQDFQGRAFYMSKVNVNMDFMKNMPPDRAAAVKARMKTATEKNYILEFNSNSSYFNEEERLDPNGQAGGFNWMQFVTGPAGGSIYKDLQSKTYINKRELFGKVFLVKDSISPSKWVLTGESKQIGIYSAYKATITREVEERAFGFGNRNNSSEETNNPPLSKTREVVMSAWFTPQIPVSTGPAMYGGLPGLILEINDDRTTMLCTKVILNPKEKIKIKAPSKGKEVTLVEFEQIAKEKAEEMRNMYRGRGGNRSSRLR